MPIGIFSARLIDLMDKEVSLCVSFNLENKIWQMPVSTTILSTHVIFVTHAQRTVAVMGLVIRSLHGPPFAGSKSLELATKYVTVLYNIHSQLCKADMHHLQGHRFWKERIETLGNTSIHIIFRSRFSSKWRICAELSTEMLIGPMKMTDLIMTSNVLFWSPFFDVLHNYDLFR